MDPLLLHAVAKTEDSVLVELPEVAAAAKYVARATVMALIRSESFDEAIDTLDRLREDEPDVDTTVALDVYRLAAQSIREAVAEMTM